MTELPEIEMQIEKGDLNLTNLAKVQSFVRAEKLADCSLSKEEKLRLITELENKTTRQVENELLERSHQPALLAEKFQRSPLSQTAEISLPQYSKFEALLNPRDQELLQEFRNLYGRELQDHSAHSVLLFLLEKAIHHKKKKHGLVKSALKNNAALPSAPNVNIQTTKQRRPIKISVKKKIWQRAEACCEHRNPNTQERCPSKFALEIDHLQPLALGGADDPENLRLLCRAHNSRRAVKTFGVYKT
jgi:hypothetical protein